MRNEVRAALKDDRFISILLDESTDAGNISQLGITYRIAHFGNVTQLFAALIPMGVSHGADAILSLLRVHLKGAYTTCSLLHDSNESCSCRCAQNVFSIEWTIHVLRTLNTLSIFRTYSMYAYMYIYISLCPVVF